MLHAGAGAGSENEDFEMDSDLMDLDEAANVTADVGGGEEEDGEDGNAVEEFGLELNFGPKPLAKMLGLSVLEQLKWLAGFPLPTSEIAHRIMTTLDREGTGTLPRSALDFIVKHIQDELPLSKETFDLAEVCFACFVICIADLLPALIQCRAVILAF